MGKKLDQAFTKALATVQLDEERIAALHFAVDGIRNIFTASELEKFNILHRGLYQKLNESYRRLFMFAHVSQKEEHVKEARRIAYEHYLKKNSSIMEHLELGYGYPGSHLIKDEEEFREEIEESKKNAE